MPSHKDDDPDSARVPLFGTWRNIYAAVIVTVCLMIGFVFLLSRFPYLDSPPS